MVQPASQTINRVQHYATQFDDKEAEYSLAPISRAMHIATKAVREDRLCQGRYRVIKVERLYRKHPRCWQVTFKQADLIPSDPKLHHASLGGEIHVVVDLRRGDATIRYGE